MSYSNINKDFVQVVPNMTVKRIILIIILIGITTSSLLNTFNQWMILKEATSRNKEMEMKIRSLEEDNHKLERQIEYATSSANISRKTREYLGLGTENDYWIILPKSDGDNKITTLKKETVENPVIIQWWNLFTNQD